MKKIFVIEDEKALGDMYELELKSCGFETKIIRDGESAIQEIKNEKPDLILLDLLLPRLKGAEVLENLKSSPETKNIPVFILTNYDTVEDRKMGIRLGVEKYILKTNIIPKEIGEMVKKRLEEIDN